MKRQTSSGPNSEAKKVKTCVVDRSRVKFLTPNRKQSPGPVIYWMRREQRICDNWALEFAAELAKDSNQPLAVVFNLVPSFLQQGQRQYGFMVRGLVDIKNNCQDLKLPFYLLKGDPTQTVPKLVKSVNCGVLVSDMCPLRENEGILKSVIDSVEIPVYQGMLYVDMPLRTGRDMHWDMQSLIEWKDMHFPLSYNCPLIECKVDAHNVVPIWEASNKVEHSARTIRPKIMDQLPVYCTNFPPTLNGAKLPPWPKEHECKPADIEALIKEVEKADTDVPEVTWLQPGQNAALAALQKFLKPPRINGYAKLRNDPTLPNGCSNLSPYMHFGHIAPQRCAYEARQVRSKYKEGVDAFIEEMVVRRELSDNYCYFQEHYDKLTGAYQWAQTTLQEHADDPREYVYTRDQLEHGKTHDDLWNAAEKELLTRGKIHGFMRMYWAKKILEWTNSPQEALDISIYLNDKYHLDGRDPNGYVGCLWSIAGVHDRAWTERPVFGKIRFMNYNGCKRKFDIQKYIQRVNSEAKWKKKK